MASTHQQQQAFKLLVEEKHFRLDFEEGAPLVRRAIEHALGMELDELATGMWSGTKEVDGYSHLEATVRALRTDDGMNVEVRLEHRFNAKAVTAFVLGIAIGCVVILPLIPTVMVANRLHRKYGHQRLVEMHKVWTEIAEAVGAPRRAGYRERPERAYAPLRVEEERPKKRVALADDDEADPDEREAATIGGRSAG